MRIFIRVLTITFLAFTGAVFNTYALDLYVDTETKQIFSEPGSGRVHMGTFEKSGKQRVTQQNLPHKQNHQS